MNSYNVLSLEVTILPPKWLRGTVVKLPSLLTPYLKD